MMRRVKERRQFFKECLVLAGASRLGLAQRRRLYALAGLGVTALGIAAVTYLTIGRRPTSEIKRLAREEGMTFLRESGLQKVRAGVTTLKEINKVTFIE